VKTILLAASAADFFRSLLPMTAFEPRPYLRLMLRMSNSVPKRGRVTQEAETWIEGESAAAKAVSS
jgi:hypothetical protein